MIERYNRRRQTVVNGALVRTCYYLGADLHRHDGPALIDYSTPNNAVSGSGESTGVIFTRENGPRYLTPTARYFLYGVEMTMEEYSIWIMR